MPLAGALLLACRVTTDAPIGVRVVTDLRPDVVSGTEFPHGLDVTLMATNRGGRRVRVAQRRPDAAHDSTGGAPVGFGLRITRADGARFQERWVASRDTVVALHGGETVRAHFHLDFRGNAEQVIPPGDYRVIGSFGEVEAPAVRLRVLP